VTDESIFPVWTDRRFRNNDIFTVKGRYHEVSPDRLWAQTTK